MDIVDYGQKVEQVGTWISAETKLKPGDNLLLEPTLPEGPDSVALLFESGGTWNTESGFQDWRLVLITRAPTQAGARALAIACLKGALSRWKTASDRKGILNLRVESLPALQPRDERGRVLLQASLVMRIVAPLEPGLDS